jgi:hypothetical protein
MRRSIKCLVTLVVAACLPETALRAETGTTDEVIDAHPLPGIGEHIHSRVDPYGQLVGEQSCALDEEQTAWLQRALDGWSRLTGEILHIPEQPLPWIVSFDESCVWHVAAPEAAAESSREVETSLVLSGAPVRVQATPHSGTVELPSGSEIPARAMAFASLWDDGQETFFVLAMRSVWLRDHPAARDHDLEGAFVGIAAHELVHTRQLVEMSRRVGELKERCELPEDISDETIEGLFADDPDFGGALERERVSLLEAAAADPARRRELAAEALDGLRRRRQRFFAGDTPCYAELEDLFLALEGTATWAHFQLAGLDEGVDFLARHPGLSDRSEVLQAVQGRKGEWVQDVGFALFLLIDDYLPNWKASMLASELASPVELLSAALAEETAGEP